MSRKSLILCVTVLVGMLLVVGIAVFCLYSGTDVGRKYAEADGPAAFDAIPADAALVAYGSFADLAPFDADEFAGLKRCGISVSLHYSGKLHALYVLDLKKAEDAGVVRQVARRVIDAGMIMEQFGELMIFSSSVNLLKSSVRHLESEVSVNDSDGFRAAYKSVAGGTVLLIPSVYVGRLMSASFTGQLTRYSSFIERVADWYAFEVSDALPIDLEGTFAYDGDDDEFLSTFASCIPGTSSVAECLPSYTLFAVTLPIRNISVFAESYQTFADSRQVLKSMKTKQKSLADKNNIAPMELLARLQIEELATAGFVVGSKVERVNLIKVACRDMELILQDSGINSLRGYKPAVHKWKYASYLSSVCGNLFQLKDESCCTYIDGWIVVGSHAAVDEFVSKGALDYTLKEYAAHAGQKDLLSAKPALAIAYFSLSEDRDRLADYLAAGFINDLNDYVPASDYNPAVLSVGKEGDKVTVCATVNSLKLSRTKAPSYDRDTTVVVPEGPFMVKMSRSGAMNSFYQNKQKSICLSDEKGQDLWGIPFRNNICGTAYSLDIFGNGKYQIIFGAGSSIYVVDRLGRYVYGYPLDLGKDILLGPDLYDFSGSGKYNLMVLHKDNTIEMYDLKGHKPASWKTIALKNETIKALPEKFVAGGKTYWIVRTSLQTHIYPFTGGSPLTDFQGDCMIRPDSKVVVGEEGVLEFICYDGKKRILEIE